MRSLRDQGVFCHTHGTKHSEGVENSCFDFVCTIRVSLTQKLISGSLLSTKKLVHLPLEAYLEIMRPWSDEVAMPAES